MPSRPRLNCTTSTTSTTRTGTTMTLGVGIGLWAGALLLALPLSGCCSGSDCASPPTQNPTPRITNPAPPLMTGTNLPTSIGTVR